METAFRDKFTGLWSKYFPNADLPIAFFYTPDNASYPPLPPAKGRVCLIGQLTRVVRGETLCFDHDSVGCFGGRRYLGFSHEIMPDFEYFLSCGIPGKLEGERYKKSPELVKAAMKHMSVFEPPAPYIVFKRWDRLDEAETPEAVVFFATPDVLSGLFTLANFDEEASCVITPFGAGCGTIVQYPALEARKERPCAVLGMFDVSARPFVPASTLSFSVPMSKFRRMVDNMDAELLITPSWEKVKKRL